MRLHLATSPYWKVYDILKKHDVKNVLISRAFYKYPEDYLKVSKGWWPEHLIVDSGAFSVWTGGKGKDKIPTKINLDDYIEFCHKIREICPNRVEFVNLDVLPGKFGQRPTAQEREDSAVEGWTNMEKMQENGITPIHVFHQHEDFKWLDKMMNHLPYIGISPANDVSMKEKMAWLKKVFFIVRTKVKTHGFAVTSHRQVLEFPFYSVDSSSWLAGARYGRTPLYKDGRVQSVNYKKDLNKFFESATMRGMDFDKYLSQTEEGLKAYLQLEKFANDLWAKRGIIWPD